MAEGPQEGFIEASPQEIVTTEVIECSPCSTTDLRKEATLYCLQCKEYLCNECVLQHGKFAILKDHKIIDKDHVALNDTDTSEDTKSSKFSRACDKHPGHTVERFCLTHSVLCCSLCITESHSACLSDTIQTVATGIVGTEMCKKVGEQLERMKQQVNFLLQNKYREADTRLQSYVKEGIAKSQEIATVILKQYIAACGATLQKDVKTGIDRSKGNLQEILREIKDCQVSMDSISDLQEELFIFANRQNSKLSNFTSLIKVCSSQLPYPWLIHINHEFDKVLSNFVSMKRTTKTNVPIKQEKEVDCEVSDIQCLSDGRYIVADKANKNLKLFGRNGEVVTVESIDGKVLSVSETSIGKIAVILPEEKQIIFFEVTDVLEKLNTIDTNIVPTGLTAFRDQIFVCFQKQIRIVNNNGEWQERISKDENGENHFTDITGVLANSRLGIVYVIDDGTLYALQVDSVRKSKRGSGVFIFNEKDFRVSLSLDQDNSVYVTTPTAIVHYTQNLKAIQTFMYSDFIENPNAGVNVSPAFGASTGGFGQQSALFGQPAGLFGSAPQPAFENVERKIAFSKYSICCNNCLGQIYIGMKSNSIVKIQIG